jgi:hypothetical protein
MTIAWQEHGQDAELLIVKAGGTHNYHWILKG